MDNQLRSKTCTKDNFEHETKPKNGEKIINCSI